MIITERYGTDGIMRKTATDIEEKDIVDGVLTFSPEVTAVQDLRGNYISPEVGNSVYKIDFCNVVDMSVTNNNYTHMIYRLLPNTEIVSAPKLKRASENVFARCAARQLKLPSVTKVDKEAFFECYYLEEVDLSKAKEIGSSAFDSCRKLHSVIFSDCLEKIEGYAFSKCNKLEEINIYAAIPDDAAFHDCPALKVIKTSEIEILGRCWIDNCMALQHIEQSNELYLPEIRVFKFPLVTGDNNALYEYEVAAPNATLKVVSCPKEMLVYEYVQRINSGNTLIYVLYGGEYFAVKIDNEVKVCDLENMKELIKFHSLF